MGTPLFFTPPDKLRDEAFYYASLGSPTKGVDAVRMFATQVRIEERKKLGEWLYARKVPSGDNWYMSASPVYDTANLEITKGELEALKRGELPV